MYYLQREQKRTLYFHYSFDLASISSHSTFNLSSSPHNSCNALTTSSGLVLE